ncbi:GNAT family N-acetyltransferase [Haloferula rosea]|uniref:GNAT family N-acetyltransferase n=1 Tax=Haloferula rosea TaxID=490093 RepID=A0A934VDZ7_9BACT|nr:GNAT family N-acetyltransferase [Haloferula rosea]MBK1825437.1 GNAT family N-acetyltransferase [Haloferula rosea]
MKRILHTERLTLRPFRRDDAEAVTHWVSDHRVAEMTTLIPHPYAHTEAIDWIDRLLTYDDDHPHQVFAITLRDTGELIGCIGLHRNETAPMAEFGYWLGVPFWGNGYATEALQAVLRLGFEDLGLRRIGACHFAHNPASGRVMQKAGLTHEGTQRLGAQRGNQLFDRVNYGLIDDDWMAVHPK